MAVDNQIIVELSFLSGLCSRCFRQNKTRQVFISLEEITKETHEQRSPEGSRARRLLERLRRDQRAVLEQARAFAMELRSQVGVVRENDELSFEIALNRTST